MKRASSVTLSLATLTGCVGRPQSMLDAAGPQAGRTDVLWWSFFWLLGGIFLAVMIVLLLTLTRRDRGVEPEITASQRRPAPASESRMRRLVTGASILSIVVLFVLIIASVSTGKANSELSARKNPLTIEVTGNQWWWQIRYVSDDPSRNLVSADEIHIPVGRPIQIRGLSNDVIHSFWVPNLNGKRDLIPSRVTTEWLEADRPGVYRGQCAEFCGLQHAHMAIWVIAEREDEFEAWLESQLQPAIPPHDPVKQRGQQVFLNSACIFCHQIRGTTAAGQNAPDLTHFGSRIGIAANTVPNTKGNLSGWIVDPQSMKPGNHMAAIAVNPTDLQPLTEYLESLK